MEGCVLYETSMTPQKHVLKTFVCKAFSLSVSFCTIATQTPSPCLFLETASAPVAPTATVEPAPAYTLSVEPTPAIVEPQGQSQLEQPCIADPW